MENAVCFLKGLTMYVPEHFKLQGWFPPFFFNKLFPHYGIRLWEYLDNRILITADEIRKRYNCPFIMNTWFSESMMEAYGLHQWRGYRDEFCPYLKKEKIDPFKNLSMHGKGSAQDSVPVGNISVEEIREDILRHPFKQPFQYITGLELDVSWLHIDCRNWNKRKYGIKTFRRPKQEGV